MVSLYTILVLYFFKSKMPLTTNTIFYMPERNLTAANYNYNSINKMQLILPLLKYEKKVLESMICGGLFPIFHDHKTT